MSLRDLPRDPSHPMYDVRRDWRPRLRPEHLLTPDIPAAKQLRELDKHLNGVTMNPFLPEERAPTRPDDAAP